MSILRFRVTGSDSFLAFDNLSAANLDIQTGLDQNSDTIIVRGTYSGNVTIDTRSLANGTHRLVLVASDGKSAGVQVVTFVVAN